MSQATELMCICIRKWSTPLFRTHKNKKISSPATIMYDVITIKKRLKQVSRFSIGIKCFLCSRKMAASHFIPILLIFCLVSFDLVSEQHPINTVFDI